MILQPFCIENLSPPLFLRLEVCLQQNQIMDIFVDDCRALSDEDWLTGSSSGMHLKVVHTHTHTALTTLSVAKGVPVVH